MPDSTPLQTGWDLTEPGTAVAAFLGTLPTSPRLLALGEPTHGALAFPAWRNRLFCTLAEEHGFRSIALESDIIAGQRVNAHVTSGQDTLDEVMQAGFSHGLGAVTANRDLVRWVRAFNAGREASDQVHFYGFDAPLEWWAPSPRASLLALHAFLSAHVGDLPVDTATLEHLCGEEARWTNPAAVRDAAQSVGNSEDARQLRLPADDLATLLRTETPGLAAQEGVWDARLHARTALGLLRYHALLANPAPTRMERAAALRDLMMADNLMAIAGREQERGPTLVFAHTTHLQRHRAAMTLGDTRLEWWSAGAHVSGRLGAQYAFIRGALGTAPDERGPTTGADSATLFSSRDLTLAALAGSVAKSPDDPSQASSFPLEPRHLPLTDGVLFVKTAPDGAGSVRPADPPDQGAP